MRAILTVALAAGFVGLAGADDKKDPVGTWKLEYEIGGQKREATLKVKKDGDKLTGTMSWPEQKDAKLADVTLKGGELTFSAVRELQDQKLTVKYALKVDGDAIKGKGEVEVGGEKHAFDIAGKRGKKDD